MAYVFEWNISMQQCPDLLEIISKSLPNISVLSLIFLFFVFGDFNLHHKDLLTYSVGTDSLTELVNFPTQIPNCDSRSPVLLDFLLSSDARICSTIPSTPLWNSDRVVVSVFIDFPVNSKWDAPFHCIAYDYSRADWDGFRHYLRDVPWEDIFKLSASAAVSEFCEWVQVGIDKYMPHLIY